MSLRGTENSFRIIDEKTQNIRNRILPSYFKDLQAAVAKQQALFGNGRVSNGLE
jgi:hypothetical protein